MLSDWPGHWPMWYRLWSVVGRASENSDQTAYATAKSWDWTVKVWDARTGQETLTLKGHSDSVQSVAFSPDGWRLASASADGTVKVWDARPLDADPAKPGPTSR
jgi:WD40 repeat protein